MALPPVSDAVASGADVILERKVDGIPRKPATHCVGASVSRSYDSGTSGPGETSVRHQREVRQRHASSCKRDYTRQSASHVGQANEPMAASRTRKLVPLDGPGSVGERIGREAGLRLREGRRRQNGCNCCHKDDAAYKISCHVSNARFIPDAWKERATTQMPAACSCRAMGKSR